MICCICWPTRASSSGAQSWAKRLCRICRRLRHHHLTLICPAPASAHERYQAELAPLFDTVHLVAREQPIPALMGAFEPALARAGLRVGGADLAAARAFQARVRSVVASGS